MPSQVDSASCPTSTLYSAVRYTYMCWLLDTWQTPGLGPAELEIEDVDDDERQRIQQVSHKTRPEREIGPEAGEEAHYGADKEDDEDLRREIPRQTPNINEGQEHSQAERVVHGHPTVDLQVKKTCHQTGSSWNLWCIQKKLFMYWIKSQRCYLVSSGYSNEIRGT